MLDVWYSLAACGLVIIVICLGWIIADYFTAEPEPVDIENWEEIESIINKPILRSEEDVFNSKLNDAFCDKDVVEVIDEYLGACLCRDEFSKGLINLQSDMTATEMLERIEHIS